MYCSNFRELWFRAQSHSSVPMGHVPFCPKWCGPPSQKFGHPWPSSIAAKPQLVGRWSFRKKKPAYRAFCSIPQPPIFPAVHVRNMFRAATSPLEIGAWSLLGATDYRSGYPAQVMTRLTGISSQQQGLCCIQAAFSLTQMFVVWRLLA